MKILVFGAGANGKACRAYIKRYKRDEFAGFLDNDVNKRTIKDAEGKESPVYRPEEITNLQYDQIWISNSSRTQVLEIKEQLKKLCVPKDKVFVLLDDQEALVNVLSNYNQYDELTDNRVVWLRNFAGYAKEEKLEGNVAECGVYMGEFSYFINRYFPDKSLYLFDTFEGFDEQDLRVERSHNNDVFLKSIFNDQSFFAGANEHIVLERMLHPEKCVLKKGYFPETAVDVNDQFCFVNLDMDLYQPMLAGLRFFYEKMCSGGVILMHDYFHPELPGVKQAVTEFEKERGLKLCKVPIGDFCSIAVVVP